MSRYIQVLNALKQNMARLSLTSGQTTCRTQILERLAYPGILNLYGLHGSGKTVLGWYLASEGHAIYVVEPSRLHTLEQDLPAESGSVIAFVDNAGHRRDEYRRILDELTRMRIRQAVIVTQERIEDFVQAVMLAYAPSDMDIVINNLSRVGFPPVPPPNEAPFLDLWDVLQFSVRR